MATAATAEPVLQADACIVGAGPAGAVMALELARRGIDVLVLEAGPRHDLARRADYARRFTRGENPWRMPLPELDRYTLGGSVPYRLEWRRARGVGGGSLHWEGYTLRFHPNDFRMRSLYGVADDWPISYDDLEPYYGRAEKALGVAGADDDPWGSPRTTGFPLPPFALSYTDGIFTTACRAVGVALHRFPQARNSIPYGARAQCRACGTCEVCPTGAKASVDLTHIAPAEATGHARVLSDVTVLRLEVGPSGRVSEAIFAGHDRRERRAAARLFVLAGGAIENARLLLLSRSSRFPDGLANGSGLVGKYFMSHPAVDVTGRMSANVFPFRTGFSSALSRQFAVDRGRARDGAYILEFLNSAGPWPAVIARDSNLRGEALRRHVRQEFGRTLGIRVYTEQLPDRENMVTLDRDVNDYFGRPVPRITYHVGDYESRALDDATAVCRRILAAAGASDIRRGRLSFAGHQIGTHRMGRDPRSSVVDPDLQAHDVPDLYLLGSGCFVTATSSPPTLTIAALAIRAAERVAARLGRPDAGMQLDRRRVAL